jgi:Fe-S cluster biogenesis protein NfuA
MIAPPSPFGSASNSLGQDAHARSDHALQERLHRVDKMLQDVERWHDPEARARTKEIVQTLMEFHGAGVERILEKIADLGPAGQTLIDSLAKDDLIANLLLLYGLHPLELEDRVQAALEKTRPYLHSHGGNVELLGINEGIVHLRLQGSCHGCPSSAQTLRQTIEEAIHESAPDIAGIHVEGEIEQEAVVPQAISAGRVSLPLFHG